jgi:hypothetical protein
MGLMKVDCNVRDPTGKARSVIMEKALVGLC